MADSYEELDPYVGHTWWLLLKDCSGTTILRTDITSISYSIYKYEYGEYTAVTGHSNVNVPLTCIVPITTDSHTNEQYNFKHTITDTPNLPYPENSTIYRTVYKFTTVSGITSAHIIDGLTL